MSTESSPRRRGVAETTANIRRAATALVLTHGYDEVTVDMICHEAGVSQRTFFNHFKTKDAAILGPELPTIDERAARAFLVSDGPLLAELVGLIRVDPQNLPADPRQLPDTLRAIASHPVLLARQMERLSAIETDLREIIELRLRREATDTGATAEELERIPLQAEVIMHIGAGVLRYAGMEYARRAGEGAAPPPLGGEDFTELLRQVIAKLA
jgi:AcrR family transcriptional regulator